MNTTYPEAEVVLEKGKNPKDGYSWVVKKCPFCGKKHSHGAGANGDDPRKTMGHRVPHCADKSGQTNSGYVLVEKE